MKMRNKINQKNGQFQQGAVLLTVLLVVVFLSLILLDIGKSVQYQSTLNRNLLQRDQGFEYLIGMEELAKIYLKKAFDNSKDENVNLSQPWAKKNIEFPFDGGSMSGVIRDMQSCFNLNSIAMLDTSNNASNNNPNNNQGPRSFPGANVNSAPQTSQQPDEQNKITIGEQILTLLIEKSVDNTAIQASAIAAAVRDWIDQDTTPSGPDGAEDSFYQGLQVPYLPPNGPIAHVSELRVIKGMDPMSYAQIRSDLCVLPDPDENKINVNTITLEGANLLYAALDGKVTMDAVNQLISERPDSGYTLQAFWDKVGSTIKIPKKVKARIDISSRFFQLNAKAELNQTRVYMTTLFARDDENNFAVVSRYFGKE